MAKDFRVQSTAWVPQYQDAGYDALISSLAPSGKFKDEFLTLLNQSGSQPDMNDDMLLEYISNRQVAGALTDVTIKGETLPPAPERIEAPAGFGQDGTAIWFSTPDTNPEGGATSKVAYYVGGQHVLTQEQDLATNRSIAKATLGVQANDIVQVGIISSSNVVGWWGRVTVS